MSILRSGEAESTEERDAYLRYANARRRGENGENGGGEGGNGESVAMENGGELSPQRLEELAAGEQLLLSVADDGSGTRTTAYEYTLTGRRRPGVGQHPPSRAPGPEG